MNSLIKSILIPSALVVLTINPALADRTTSYAYDPVTGLIETVDGPRTDVADITSYEYDNDGNLEKITNALNHVIQITSHDASGRPLTIIDPNLIQTTLTWTPRGWLESVTTDGKVLTLTYAPDGRLERIKQGDSYIRYFYTDEGYVQKIRDNHNNRIVYTYDQMGNLTRTDRKDPAGTLKYKHTQTFDLLQRVKKSIDSVDNATEFGYDGNDNLTAVDDPLDRVTANTYDPLGRIDTSTDPLNGVTDYDYWPSGNLKTVTAPNGAVTTYHYNTWDQVTQILSPDTGTTDITYDSAGNVETVTDARTITATYTYDALNRVKTISYPDAGENVTFNYDLFTNGVGKLSEVIDATGTTRFHYDTRGNLASREIVNSEETLTTTWTYDDADRIASITYPTGAVVTYNRDVAGNVTSVDLTDATGNTQPLLSNIARDPFGPITDYTFGNDLVYTSSFDLDLQLDTQVLSNATQSILDYDYGYDIVGNIDAIADLVDPAKNRSYGYDDLDRLTSEAGAYGSRSYLYDAVANREERTVTDTGGSTTEDYVYTPDSNRLESVDTSQVVLDAAGNIISMTSPNEVFDYNDAGRLESFHKYNKKRAEYAYNGFGERVIKRVFNTTTGLPKYDDHFSYGDNAQLMHQVRYHVSYPKKAIETIWLEGRPVAQLKSHYTSAGDISSQEITYLHTDHLGSPRIATDESGAEVWRWEGDAFGRDPAIDVQADNLANDIVHLRHPGQYYDAESGLYYNYFRYYDPDAGRYITSDPIGLAGGLNTYGYVGGNPAMGIDPLGLFDLYGYPLRDFRSGEWRTQYELDFSPLANPNDLASKLSKLSRRADFIFDKIKTKPARAKHPIKDFYACGVLDSDLEREYIELYGDKERLDENETLDFLNNMRDKYPKMKELYQRPDQMVREAKKNSSDGWYCSLVGCN